MFRRRIHAAAEPPRAAFFQQPPPRDLRRMRRGIFRLESPPCPPERMARIANSASLAAISPLLTPQNRQEPSAGTKLTSETK